MKARELMIDDWVRYKKSKFPFRVAGITNMGTILPSTGGNYQMNSFEPIPLTEEILIANGFEICGHHAMFYIEKDTPDEITIHIDYAESYDIDSPCYRLSGMCKHVHELQQAMRIAKIPDLADNFKLN